MISAWLLLLFLSVFPSWFVVPIADTSSTNGSSRTGHCSSVRTFETQYRCETPTSSVLFDGHIPTLTEIDGHMWASQLLTLQATTPIVLLDFSNTPNYFGIWTVEFIIFNCPEWGISIPRIIFYEFDSNSNILELGFSTPTISSCDSLVKICMRLHTSSTSLSMSSFPGQLYLAEVTFYANSFSCPRDSIITTQPPPDTTQPPPDTTTHQAVNFTITSSPDTTTSPLPPTSKFTLDVHIIQHID